MIAAFFLMDCAQKNDFITSSSAGSQIIQSPTTKGIYLITLYTTDQNSQNIPINFRIYDKSESKTKNDYFMDMLSEVLSWGAKIQFITGDIAEYLIYYHT